MKEKLVLKKKKPPGQVLLNNFCYGAWPKKLRRLKKVFVKYKAKRRKTAGKLLKPLKNLPFSGPKKKMGLTDFFLGSN